MPSKRIASLVGFNEMDGVVDIKMEGGYGIATLCVDGVEGWRVCRCGVGVSVPGIGIASVLVVNSGS